MRNRTWMIISCLAITAVLQGLAISRDQQILPAHRPAMSLNSTFELETLRSMQKGPMFELSMVSRVHREGYDEASLLPEMSEDLSWEDHPEEAMEAELEQVLQAERKTQKSSSMSKTGNATSESNIEKPVPEPEAWHTVKPGETLSSIARLYNMAVSSLVLYNGLSNPNVIRPGFRLQLSFESEFEHLVRAGDSLWSIADRYGLSLNAVRELNPHIQGVLKVGQKVHIRITDLSEKNMQRVLTARNLGGRFMWPAQGRVSDSYGWRVHPITKRKNFHKGLDIAAPTGTQIQAARSGKVVFAGALKGYGNIVIIDHRNGLKTRYAHCSSLDVKRGQSVRQGQKIAEIGATGMATGPHLHFEIRRKGKPLDPREYL